MRLLVDVGNSRIKWHIVSADGNIVSQNNAYSHKGIDPSEWLDTLWRSLTRPSRVIIANVAGPAFAASLSTWIRANWSVEPVFAESRRHEFGINNGYDKPELLGVDRWIALVGARMLTHNACAVIDCGTAVTIDAMTADGQHLGGVIMPGVRLMHGALYRSTTLTGDIPPDKFAMLGRNTRDCIWGGTIHAIAAAIDRISAHMAESVGGNGAFTRIITGGNAISLIAHLEHDYRLEPNLIFHGLQAIADHPTRATD